MLKRPKEIKSVREGVEDDIPTPLCAYKNIYPGPSRSGEDDETYLITDYDFQELRMAGDFPGESLGIFF